MFLERMKILKTKEWIKEKERREKRSVPDFIRNVHSESSGKKDTNPF